MAISVFCMCVCVSYGVCPATYVVVITAKVDVQLLHILQIFLQNAACDDGKVANYDFHFKFLFLFGFL